MRLIPKKIQYKHLFMSKMKINKDIQNYAHTVVKSGKSSKKQENNMKKIRKKQQLKKLSLLFKNLNN